MTRVETVQDATEIALGFLKPYWGFARPLRATRRRGVWRVQVDVGSFHPKVGWVSVDVETGKVIDYRLPLEASSKGTLAR